MYVIYYVNSNITYASTWTYHSHAKVTYDHDSGLDIEWNVIDLPRTLTTGSGTGSSSTQRAYLADGSLAQVGDGTTTRLYLGDIIFNKASNGTVTLESAGWEGGRLLPGSGSDKVLYTVADHLGSVRVVKDGMGNIRQRFDYYPYGTVSYVWTNSSTTDSSEKRYRFGGKEIAGSSLTDLAGTGAAPGASYLDFGARLYSPRTATWLSPDPLMEKYYGVSPYVYCMNDPNLFIDFFGANPVYSPQGTFLGTDELGLNGDWLVMDENLFYQGMLHVDAANLSVVPPSKKTVEKITRHFNSLSTRPDFDGVVTIIEGVNWAKQHPYALSEPTPDNTLYIDSSKLNFGFLSTSDFSSSNGIEDVNLFNFKNLAASMDRTIRSTVYALGRVSIELVDRESRTVRIVNNDATNYDWNKGGSFIRNSFIIINNSIFRLDSEKHGFKVFYYGIGKLNK